MLVGIIVLIVYLGKNMFVCKPIKFYNGDIQIDRRNGEKNNLTNYQNH